jgi:hypothetical protein
MVDPTDITPQVSTVTDSAATVPPEPDTVGLNAVPHTLAGADLSAGVTFLNTGNEIVLLRKTSATELVVTAQCGNACSQGYKSPEHDVVAHIQAGNVTPTWKVLGKFQKSRYNQTTAAGPNRVLLTFSGGSTTIELLVIQAPLVGE